MHSRPHVRFIVAWVPALICLLQPAHLLRAGTESEQRGIVVVAEQLQDGSIGGPLNNEQVNLGRYHALLIGISTYQTPGFASKLVTPVNDVHNLKQVLVDEYGFSNVELLLDGDATRAGILRALTRLRDSDLGASDSVLIYYAGHGYQKPETKDGFWIPVDGTGEEATWVPVTDITRILKNFRSKHTLLISDSCFSGTLTRSVLNLPTTDRFLAEVFRKDSYQVITSGGLEPVADGGRDGLSLFAYYLSTYLKTQPNPYVTAAQMYAELAPMVANASTSQQTPEHGKVPGAFDQNGQFVLARVKKSGQIVAAAAATQPAVGAVGAAPAGVILISGLAFSTPGEKWQLQVNRPNESLQYNRPDRAANLTVGTFQMGAGEVGQTIDEMCTALSKGTLQGLRAQKVTKDAKLGKVTTETTDALERCTYELTFQKIWQRNVAVVARDQARMWLFSMLFPEKFKDEGAAQLQELVASIQLADP